MTSLNVLVLPGDGIGPEVMKEAVALLAAVAARGGPAFNLEYAAFGGASIDGTGLPITDETMRMAREADAVLLGAVGGPKWDGLPSDRRPERGLLALRAGLDAYCNLRPAKLNAALAGASPLRPVRAGRFDFVVVRELTGDAYFGEPRGVEGVSPSRRGVNTMSYREDEIRRIGVAAFELARRRAKRLTSVDKANVLEVMALWRAVMIEVAAGYPDVALSHMYVDNCAMQLVLNPSQFDVIVSGNLFGDIISDEAGALTGSIGMLPSASIGDRGAIYEPVHGSAPDIAGKDVANPLAMILSVAMMLEHTAKRGDMARLIERAVDAVLEKGLRTADILGSGDGTPSWVTRVGTRAMGEAVVGELSKLA